MKYLIAIALFGLTLAAQTVSPPSGGGGSGSSCSGDINSGCSQVTGTHLGSPLPVGQGGTGLASGTAGKVLGGATPSMVTVTSAYVDSSIALTGTDINTSNQVTATHLASGLPIAQGGVVATSAAVGQIPNTSSSSVAAWTSTPTLGASGTLGSLAMGNASSGTVTLAPVSGALGSVTASFPANTGTVAEVNFAQTWSALQTFGTNISVGGVTPTGATGTGNFVLSASPTLTGSPLAPTQSANDNSTKVATTAYVDTKTRTYALSFIWNGAGSAVTTGTTVQAKIPRSGTLVGWDITASGSASATISTWKKADGTTLPTVANTINTSGVALSSAVSTGNQTGLTDFTSTTFTQYDQFIGSLTAVSGSPTWVVLTLFYTSTN